MFSPFYCCLNKIQAVDAILTNTRTNYFLILFNLFIKEKSEIKQTWNSELQKNNKKKKKKHQNKPCVLLLAGLLQRTENDNLVQNDFDLLSVNENYLSSSYSEHIMALFCKC